MITITHHQSEFTNWKMKNFNSLPLVILPKYTNCHSNICQKQHLLLLLLLLLLVPHASHLRNVGHQFHSA